MKKLYRFSLPILALSVVGAFFFASTAHATGESYSYTGTGSNSSGLGSDSITASGGAFKGNTVFKKISTPSGNDSANKVSGYSTYYSTSNIGLKDGATQYPGCRTTKAYIALKTPNSSDGILYIDQKSSNCNNIGFNLGNLVPPDGSLALPSDGTVSIAPNTEEVAQQAYATALAPSLDTLKAAYYTALGSKAPCSSQGCDDTTWNQWLGQCWQTARGQAADTARYQNQGGGTPYDTNAGTVSYFATCLAGHTGSYIDQGDITAYLTKHPIDAAAVNKAGGDASDAAESSFNQSNNGSTAGTTTCSIGGIGWIVCPVITFLSSLADGMFSVLADTFLKVGVNVLSQGGIVNTAWKAMQGLANVVLIIIFLIIVFSQVSNVGISNYGVKKMAPRLVIGAILINLSFIICSLAVDLSNVLGYGIRDFFDGLAQTAVQGSSVASSVLSGQVTDHNTIWSSVAGGILVVAGTAVAGYFMLSMLGSLLLAALIALVVILLILVARQAIIILAIVLAPVAIALWLLPNTEKVAKQWWKIFISMLMVFPIIALLFGGSTLASVLLTYAFNNIQGVDDSGNNWLGQIMAAAIQVIPLFATPFILKGILNSVPAIGSFASRMANRATGNLGKKASDGYQRSTFATARSKRQEARRQYQSQKVAERIRDGKGLTSVFTKGIGVTKAQQYANRSVARAALSAADEGDSKDVSAEQNALIAERVPIQDTDGGKDLIQELQKAVKKGDSVKTRAIQNILLKSGEKGRVAYHTAMANIEADGTIQQDVKTEAYESMRRNIKYNHSDIKGIDAAIDNFSNAAGGSLQNARQAMSSPDNNGLTGFDKLSDAQLAGQHIDNVRGASALATDADRAQRMLSNPTLSGMSQDVRKYLEEIVSSYGATVATATAQAAAENAAPQALPNPGTSTSGTSASATPQAPPQTTQDNNNTPGNFLG